MIRGLAFTTGACSAPFGLFAQELALGLVAVYAALFAFNVIFRPERLLPGASL